MPSLPPNPEQPIPTPITVVDYGAGNLGSVRRALEAVGQQPHVTDDAADVARASSLILPGVGSANDAMKKLRALGLVEPLREYAASGRPFFGVCVGLQLLFDWSDEGGGVECLGILPGRVVKFEPPDGSRLKVPQMGWNTLHLKRAHPLFEGVPDDSHFYFVHSYYAAPSDPTVVVGETEYGVPFAAAVARDNVVAVQFHPEKSADLGLRLYDNFARRVASDSSRVPAHSSR